MKTPVSDPCASEAAVRCTLPLNCASGASPAACAASAAAAMAASAGLCAVLVAAAGAAASPTAAVSATPAPASSDGPAAAPSAVVSAFFFFSRFSFFLLFLSFFACLADARSLAARSGADRGPASSVIFPPSSVTASAGAALLAVPFVAGAVSEPSFVATPAAPDRRPTRRFGCGISVGSAVAVAVGTASSFVRLVSGGGLPSSDTGAEESALAAATSARGPRTRDLDTRDDDGPVTGGASRLVPASAITLACQFLQCKVLFAPTTKRSSLPPPKALISGEVGWPSMIKLDSSTVWSLALPNTQHRPPRRFQRGEIRHTKRG
eukprot:m.84912 g.84912  ORF g.84912 m.84912 type:complete len:322 (-) comp19748_c0_seq2:40-1005(-)